MKFTVPVNAPDEVGALVAAGAGELYCGFLDDWWVARYGDHDSASRRQGAANLATLDDLAATAQAARACNVPLHLALNARYTEPQLDHLVQLCDAFAEMGGVGIIASDLGLLWRLRDHAQLRRCLSILAVAQNVPTLQAFRELGISRVVLPRFMQPAEAKALLAAVPGMQGEVMAFFDKCPWVDGYCRHRHGVSYPLRPADGIDEAKPLFTFDTTYRTHACLGRLGTYANPYPCAACFLPAFEEAGVAYAKLGGRGRPLEERLRALRFLVRAQQLGDDAERAALYQATFHQACSCYYGDATQDRHAIELDSPQGPEDGGHLGSEVDFAAFFPALCRMLDSPAQTAPASGETMLLVPPLSQGELVQLEQELGHADGQALSNVRFAVNDLGTLRTLARIRQERGFDFSLGLGTLLARSDDPAEIARFLSPELNPSCTIWGPAGEPRVLQYRRPPEPLVEHWAHPSAYEPSAQAALAHLVGELERTGNGEAAAQ